MFSRKNFCKRVEEKETYLETKKDKINILVRHERIFDEKDKLSKFATKAQRSQCTLKVLKIDLKPRTTFAAKPVILINSCDRAICFILIQKFKILTHILPFGSFSVFKICHF